MLARLAAALMAAHKPKALGATLLPRSASAGMQCRNHPTLSLLHSAVTRHFPSPSCTYAHVIPSHRHPFQHRKRLTATQHATTITSIASFRAAANATSSSSSVPVDDDLPFTEYSDAANSEYWSTRPVSVAKRFLQVGSVLGSWFASGRLFGTDGDSKRVAQRAERLRRILTSLGPAYIKIGQALSSRPDVMPPEYLKELETLQDRLPPFPSHKAFATIEEELRRPISDVFSYISEEPVAAASLGQVYRAVLRRDGADVAVKVQRPGVATSIALDILVLRRLASAVRKWRKFNTDLPGLLDEWATSLFKELDYVSEAANGTRFKELYSNLEGVYVPYMHSDLTTQKVLVMEWVDGERLRSAYAAVDSSGFSSSGEAEALGGSRVAAERGSMEDDLRLVEVGVRCSLEQLLEHGFYHADPHPGNLLRMRDGRLCYLDFGMMGEVDVSVRRGLIRATLHLVNREYASLADDFVTLGMLPQDADRAAVVPALTGVFAEALAGGVNNLSFGDLSANLGRTMYRFSFRIPSYYTLLVRSLSVLEGIALASDPRYKVLGAAYPWVARRLLTDQSQELRSTLMSLLYRDGRFNFRRMESLLTQAARPTGRPPRRQPSGDSGRSTSSGDGGGGGGTYDTRGDALALMLSPQGQFVRGIVIEELAKGADASWRLAADALVDTAKWELHNVSGYPLGGGPLLRAVMDVVEAAPRLADKDDADQVEGLRRLAAALQEATVAQQQQGGTQQRAASTWLPEGLGSGFTNNSGNNGGNGGGSQRTGGSGAQDDYFTYVLENLEAAAGLLQWALREAETLGPAERAEALRLPLEVGQAVASRVAARLIRYLLAGEDVKQSDGSKSGATAAGVGGTYGAASGPGAGTAGVASA